MTAASFNIEIQRQAIVYQELSDSFHIPDSEGSFYLFIEVPPDLNMTGTEFVMEALKDRVMLVPGKVFSQRDSHFRLAFTAPPERLRAGLGQLKVTLSRLRQ